MNNPSDDPARRAVEILAASVEPPAPPENLRRIRPRPIAAGGLCILAATLIAVVVAAWMLAGREVPVADAPVSDVVVEHLRIRGRDVRTRVVALPEAGAIVVMTAHAVAGAAGMESTAASAVIARIPGFAETEPSR